MMKRFLMSILILWTGHIYSAPIVPTDSWEHNVVSFEHNYRVDFYCKYIRVGEFADIENDHLKMCDVRITLLGWDRIEAKRTVYGRVTTKEAISLLLEAIDNDVSMNKTPTLLRKAG